MVVRRGPAKDVALEQRPKQDEGVSHKNIQRGESQAEGTANAKLLKGNKLGVFNIQGTSLRRRVHNGESGWK